tara:strand:- start:56 stop:184 length:129 start_codon:yes stop_codon:yes gene_type:complete
MLKGEIIYINVLIKDIFGSKYTYPIKENNLEKSNAEQAPIRE